MKKQLLTFLLLGLTTLSAFSQVPTNGLVGYWPFNGNANDESGNGNNGTVNGAAFTNDRFGNINNAYNFNGTSDYIRCLNAGPLGNPTVTVSFWVKTNYTQTSEVINWGSDAIAGKDFRVLLNEGCMGGIF